MVMTKVMVIVITAAVGYSGVGISEGVWLDRVGIQQVIMKYFSRTEIRQCSNLAFHELDYFVDTGFLKIENLGHIIIIIQICQTGN